MVLAPSESNDGDMKAFKKYAQINDKPRSLYVGCGGVFSVNHNNREPDKITQFERARKEIGTGIIHANSPQAKGRVKRSLGTHQDRLIKELRLAGIFNANEFILREYLPKHNKMFTGHLSKKEMCTDP